MKEFHAFSRKKSDCDSTDVTTFLKVLYENAYLMLKYLFYPYMMLVSGWWPNFSTSNRICFYRFFVFSSTHTETYFFHAFSFKYSAGMIYTVFGIKSF